MKKFVEIFYSSISLYKTYAQRHWSSYTFRAHNVFKREVMHMLPGELPVAIRFRNMSTPWLMVSVIVWTGVVCFRRH